MRWRLAAAIAILGIAGIPAVSDGCRRIPRPQCTVGVKPGTGSPGSHFAVSFRAGVQTGPGSLIRSYRVTAGATKRNGCQSTSRTRRSAPSPRARRSTVHVTLSPGQANVLVHGHLRRKGGGALAARVWQGAVPPVHRAARDGRQVQLPRRQAWRRHDAADVRRAPVGVCLHPGAQRPGETTPFTLTWKAATDDVTPSDEIVYDVYEATTSGGANFSEPTLTTLPA